MRPTRRLALTGTVLALALTCSSVAAAVSASAVTPQPTTAAQAGGAAASRPGSPNFSGTIALSDCSGSVIRWQTSQPTDTAMVLTNGHCQKLMNPHKVIVNKPYVRDVTLLNADGSTAGTVQTTRIVYSTMDKTDVTLYDLGLTYQQLQNQYGVPALTVASTRPSPSNQPISVISGYWKLEYTCNLHGFAYRLLENGWTWHESLRYSKTGCEVIGGTSGSPVLDASGTIIGINNTINEDGQSCTLDNPCEKDRQGHISVHEGRGYAQETWWFYTCLDSDNTFDLDKPGCLLVK